MTQLVFVHGVATRSGASYDKIVSNRDKLFKTVLFHDPNLTIHNPLWGELVPTVPKAVYDTDGGVGSFTLNADVSGVGGGLGSGGLGGGGLGAGAKAAGVDSLSAVAKANPMVALDAVFVELLERHDRQGTEILPEEIEAFTAVAAAMAADERAAENLELASDGVAALLKGVESDADLVARVRDASGAVANTYSVGSAISGAIGAITGRIRKIVSSVAFDPLADLARPAVGLFLGDVFIYLKDNNLREDVRSEIRKALLAAHDALRPGEKMVVIGHSMGGVILMDMLLSSDSAGLPADLRIDALFTVGSQPGLFQALGLYLPRSEERLPKPECVGLWYNVYDPIDPIAFRADPIFKDVKDLRFDSITGIASAHTTYFKRPQFHAKARKRLRDARVIA